LNDEPDGKPAGTLRARPGTKPAPLPGAKERPDAPPPTRKRVFKTGPRTTPERAEAPRRAPGLLPSARLSPALAVVVAAARAAGRRLLRDFGEVENLQASVKGPGDFVSEADLRAEQTLREHLAQARPDFAFLGEEGGPSADREDWEWRFVVDPLDGTTNFLHGIPHFAISVGIEKRTASGSEIVAGVVFNPASNELYWAEKGTGAYLNDRRLRVSARKSLLDAVFATGIPFAKVQRKAEFSHTLARLMPQVAGIRRFGSAALDLAWVASGRFDGFWELGLHRWDIAAGLVLVREAGGFVTDPEGGDAYASGNVVAGNPVLQPLLRAEVVAGIASAAARK
jgi:myo-inositol-1(or 4)-monophosphatase